MKDMLNQWKLRGERAEPKNPEFAAEDIPFFGGEHDEEDFASQEAAFVGAIGSGAGQETRSWACSTKAATDSVV